MTLSQQQQEDRARMKVEADELRRSARSLDALWRRDVERGDPYAGMWKRQASALRKVAKKIDSDRSEILVTARLAPLLARRLAELRSAS